MTISNIPDRQVIGVLPHREPLTLDVRVRGYNIIPGGTRATELSESISIPEIPDFLTHLEVLVDHYLIAVVPFAMGGGCWVWVPPTIEEDEDGDGA
jgi:hypothetical protein